MIVPRGRFQCILGKLKITDIRTMHCMYTYTLYAYEPYRVFFNAEVDGFCRLRETRVPRKRRKSTTLSRIFAGSLFRIFNVN